MPWRIILSVLLFALTALVTGVALQFQHFLQAPLGFAAPSQTLVIPTGTSLRGVVRRLADDGILEQPLFFTALVLIQGQQGRIKAGEFRIQSTMTPPQLLERLTSGRVVQHSITFIEGWTFRQALAAIDGHPVFGGRDLAGRPQAELMAELGYADAHPEGRLFPDTYAFPAEIAPIAILRRGMRRMDAILAEEWADRAADLPLATPYEALILASIIEKETGKTEERAEIGGVFIRRLRAGMRLETDPTVIYGMGDRFAGNITRADLRERTPYNTYLVAGLPPTPIALPGRAAIRAAVRPAPGETLFFVARGDGSHHFSKTFEEHQRAVQRYILGQ